VFPPPHEQFGLVQKVQLELGHFGVKRIYNLFAPHYHWRGMYVQVRDVIARCEQCDRVNLRMESATWCWKDLDEGYKFGLDLVAIRPGSREL